MIIHVVRGHATPQEISEMLVCHGDYIKLAVDVERGVVAGGGEFHADCEEALLKDGSKQESVWGADWYPRTGRIEYSAIINIRPSQGNRSAELVDTKLRERVASIIHERLGKVVD